MAFVFWHDECETTAEEFMKKTNHEDMKIILKEDVDKDGCKGGGFVCEISSPMKNFEDQYWNLSWKVSSLTYFQKTRWKCI